MNLNLQIHSNIGPVRNGRSVARHSMSSPYGNPGATASPSPRQRQYESQTSSPLDPHVHRHPSSSSIDGDQQDDTVIDPALREPPNTALQNARFVDMVANSVELAPKQRDQLHTLVTLSADLQLVTLGAMLMSEANTSAIMVAMQKDQAKRLTKLERLISESWTLSKGQENLIKIMVRHYLIREVSGYGVPIDMRVQKYIKKYAGKFKLGDIYPSDRIVKMAVDDYVHSSQTIVRGNFRRQIFESLTKQMPFNLFVSRTITDYHQHGKSSKLDEKALTGIRGQLAILRHCAMPLVSEAAKKKRRTKSRSKDNTTSEHSNAPNDNNGERTAHNKAIDTGFWKDVNALLEIKYRELGKDRQSDNWKVYYTGLITNDLEKYGNAGLVDNDSDDSDETDGGDNELDHIDGTPLWGQSSNGNNGEVAASGAGRTHDDDDDEELGDDSD
ncbi:hypothetical protein QCA50_012627 [Cerrena zonata]|uniref:Uncharacterized protein n=1 Tax=Cerrena zonata TaxID=2478898 RepID=A0AAW0G2Z9_9APHY